LAVVAAVVVLLGCGAALAAATYYVSPAAGSAAGDGSAAKPWKTLAEVVTSGAIHRVRPGDTILLMTGNHGAVTLSGENADFITIAAGKDQQPALSRLEIPSGTKWRIRGLRVSPSFGQGAYEGAIVTFADGGASSEIIIEDCFIYTVEDSSAWDAAKWLKANDGIFMGEHGKNLTLRNNYVLNTRFGINLGAEDSLCEGCVITNFSGDGMRVMRDGQTVQYNVIKNIYCSDADGDKNHDDGIQCFLYNKGTGTVRRVTLKGNIIINREDDKQKFATILQGIGFFDGPLIDFVVTDNVVLVDMWHGVSLYDAQNALIERNVCWTRWGAHSRLRPWVQLGGKGQNNTVRNNYACSFDLKQPGTVAENNRPCTEQIFQQALAAAHKTICEKFGTYHPVAGYARLGMQKGKNGPPAPSVPAKADTPPTKTETPPAAK
jgi:hypothetical protein